MADTIIKIDLNKSPYEHDNIHNRWHPDIPIVTTVNPGDDFIVECMDWTGGQIKNDDNAEDVRDVILEQVHFLSGPIGVKGAKPGDLLEVDILDIGGGLPSSGGLPSIRFFVEALVPRLVVGGLIFLLLLVILLVVTERRGDPGLFSGEILFT